MSIESKAEKPEKKHRFKNSADHNNTLDWQNRTKLC